MNGKPAIKLETLFSRVVTIIKLKTLGLRPIWYGSYAGAKRLHLRKIAFLLGYFSLEPKLDDNRANYVKGRLLYAKTDNR